MKKQRWRDFILINISWLGLNATNGTITPVLLPFLVALFVPAAMKNSDLATVRVIGLAVAMLVQPMAGMLSDRNTSRWGKRRPYILGGVLLSLMFLFIIGLSPSFFETNGDGSVQKILGTNSAFMVLLFGFVLLQISLNTTQAATQGLIPDLVPEDQRGRASGVKAVMELLPVFLVIIVGPLVDGGEIWLVITILGAVLLITMLLTLIFVHEEPLIRKPSGNLKEPFLRLVALTAIFVGTTQMGIWVVKFFGHQLNRFEASLTTQIVLVGFAGLTMMVGSIFIGVYFGAWVGIGQEAYQQRPFIWWVINRLLFLTAVGSIQGFALFYLSDVLHIPNAASQTTLLLGAVALFLLPSAIGGGYLADRIGRKRLVAVSGLIGAIGSFLIVFADGMPTVIISGCIIGLGTGTFLATNWALGTDLAPKEQAGKFLGISNLAGAGAGIVGAGIGGPLADFFNGLEAGLGYLVIITLYGILFLFSTLSLTQVTGVK
jgi:MFS family permease